MPPKKPHRLNQINEFIKHKFGEIINQKMELPPGVLVSITNVKTSKDLRYAKAGISIYPLDQTDAVFGAICRKIAHLKFLLHQQITFKFAPEIKIYIDKNAQKAFEIEQLLDKLKQK
ncbi:MAG: ribosome-binding factor A [Patescibacteria group bacterium]